MHEQSSYCIIDEDHCQQADTNFPTTIARYNNNLQQQQQQRQDRIQQHSNNGSQARLIRTHPAILANIPLPVNWCEREEEEEVNCHCGSVGVGVGETNIADDCVTSSSSSAAAALMQNVGRRPSGGLELLHELLYKRGQNNDCTKSVAGCRQFQDNDFNRFSPTQVTQLPDQQARAFSAPAQQWHHSCKQLSNGRPSLNANKRHQQLNAGAQDQLLRRKLAFEQFLERHLSQGDKLDLAHHLDEYEQRRSDLAQLLNQLTRICGPTRPRVTRQLFAYVRKLYVDKSEDLNAAAAAAALELVRASDCRREFCDHSSSEDEHSIALFAVPANDDERQSREFDRVRNLNGASLGIDFFAHSAAIAQRAPKEQQQQQQQQTKMFGHEFGSRLTSREEQQHDDLFELANQRTSSFDSLTQEYLSDQQQQQNLQENSAHAFQFRHSPPRFVTPGHAPCPCNQRITQLPAPVGQYDNNDDWPPRVDYDYQAYQEQQQQQQRQDYPHQQQRTPMAWSLPASPIVKENQQQQQQQQQQQRRQYYQNSDQPQSISSSSSSGLPWLRHNFRSSTRAGQISGVGGANQASSQSIGVGVWHPTTTTTTTSYGNCRELDDNTGDQKLIEFGSAGGGVGVGASDVEVDNDVEYGENGNEEEEEEEEEESEAHETLALVPRLAKGRLPLSVAEQMSEQASKFVQHYGSAASTSGASSSASSAAAPLPQPQTQAQAQANQSSKSRQHSSSQNNNLQVRRTLRVKIRKSKPILGIAIEGGFNVSGQLLPRIVCVHEEGAAYQCGKLRASDLILEVNGVSTVNMTHDQIAELIASGYYKSTRTYIEFLIGESVHV